MKTRLLRLYLREVLTGFSSLNTVARDGVAGNIRMGDLVIQQRGNILDDSEDERDEASDEEDDDL